MAEYAAESESPRVYIVVGVALMLLLMATAVLAKLPLGSWSPLAAFGIAAAKALLVAVFYMHLRLSSPLVRLFALAGVVWLGLLVVGTLVDYLTREGIPWLE